MTTEKTEEPRNNDRDRELDPISIYDVHGTATVADHIPDAEGLLPAHRRENPEFPDYSHLHG